MLPTPRKVKSIDSSLRVAVSCFGSHSLHTTAQLLSCPVGQRTRCSCYAACSASFLLQNSPLAEGGGVLKAYVSSSVRKRHRTGNRTQAEESGARWARLGGALLAELILEVIRYVLAEGNVLVDPNANLLLQLLRRHINVFKIQVLQMSMFYTFSLARSCL